MIYEENSLIYSNFTFHCKYLLSEGQFMDQIFYGAGISLAKIKIIIFSEIQALPTLEAYLHR